jgi:hypothetical protein
VALEELSPGLVAQVDRPFRRPDYVGEENGREHPVDWPLRPRPSHELLHRVEDRIHVADPPPVVRARQLDQPRALHLLGDVAGPIDRDRIADSMEDQRRRADRRQDLAHVGVLDRIPGGARHRGARHRPLIHAGEAPHQRLARKRRAHHVDE